MIAGVNGDTNVAYVPVADIPIGVPAKTRSRLEGTRRLEAPSDVRKGSILLSIGEVFLSIQLL